MDNMLRPQALRFPVHHQALLAKSMVERKDPHPGKTT
jgi:hypothetical protein